jgi:hypothetical protein
MLYCLFYMQNFLFLRNTKISIFDGILEFNFALFAVAESMFEARLKSLTPKGPKSTNGFLGSSGRLSRHQKHE